MCEPHGTYSLIVDSTISDPLLQALTNDSAMRLQTRTVWSCYIADRKRRILDRSRQRLVAPTCIVPSTIPNPSHTHVPPQRTPTVVLPYVAFALLAFAAGSSEIDADDRFVPLVSGCL